ncbi:cytochrome P450 [Ceratobasidium sp. AG-I]|nr:cytochrome P450 [Ceratobasidium sp. AG-I]
MIELVSYVVLPAVGILGTRWIYRMVYARTALPLPPGPPSYPLIGQLLSMPKQSEQLAFTEMSKTIGSDILSLSFLGTTIIVLNSEEAAIDLLEKRTSIYSGRFTTPMVSSPLLLNLQNFVAFMDSNERWKRYRRMMHTRLNKQAVVEFQASQQHQARLLLQRLLNKSKHLTTSDEVDEEFHIAISSTLLDSVYGYQLESAHDPFVVNATKFSDNLGKAFLPSNFLVNSLPWLAHVPQWFPGANFKKIARKWKDENDLAVNGVYEWTKQHITNGADEHSMLATTLKEVKQLGWDQETIDDYLKMYGMGIYSAGTDTLINALLSFLLAMIMFPEVQAKAQQEIDSVISQDRLPTVEDRSRLPYIENLASEVLRWQPPAPLAIPHTCDKEDEYRGYRIPKGSIVFGNVWGMTRDERIYPDPEDFNPDRYFDPAVPAPPTFGWGGRHCPGSHFAQTGLFIVAASILAAFKITKLLDENGREIVPEIDSESNSVRFRPKPFGCKFTPRSDLHAELIRNGA